MKRLFALGSIVFLLVAADAGAGYATKVSIGEDVELSLYTERMFRVRTSKLEGETFPTRYEIPFAIGHLDERRRRRHLSIGRPCLRDVPRRLYRVR